MLALALGGRSVAEWQAAISHVEFMDWVDFYTAHPFDDQHRYHRPAAVIGSMWSSASISALVDQMVPRQVVDVAGRSAADLTTLAAFGAK